MEKSFKMICLVIFLILLVLFTFAKEPHCTVKVLKIPFEEKVYTFNIKACRVDDTDITVEVDPAVSKSDLDILNENPNKAEVYKIVSQEIEKAYTDMYMYTENHRRKKLVK